MNRKGDTIAVHIVTQGDRTVEKVIGEEEGSDFFFPWDEAVSIKGEMNDTFDALLPHSATINLQARYYEPSLFGTTCRDGIVNILRNENLVFAGYIEPLSYSQNYNETYDDISLNCIDCLSALQYSNYRNVGAAGVTYAKMKSEADQRTFLDILEETLGNVTSGVDLLGGRSMNVYYDGTKAVSSKSGREGDVFSGITISELLFYGDEEDDTWTQEEVVKQILTYLNLHAVQEGMDIYLFDWETMRRGENVTWQQLAGGGSGKTTYPRTLDIRTGIVADSGTQIDVCEAYNQLQLTDDVKEVENIVESPLDSDSLVSKGNFQKYMTELIAEGEGESAWNGMKEMCLNGTTSYDAATQIDWFCWPKTMTNWKFHYLDGKRDIYSDYPADGTNQQDILNLGLTQGIGACVCAFGSVERNNGGNDNSPVTSVSMENYLIISTNGKTIGDVNYPTSSEILKACPVAEYVGNTAGGTFSPSDEETTNYVVISGKMVLNPIMEETSFYAAMCKEESWKEGFFRPFWHQTVPSRNNGDGRYYTRKYWKAAKWSDAVEMDETANVKDTSVSFYPYTATGPQEYEFAYSAVGTETDTVKKVGLVACMLVIGDKCVVEKRKGQYLGDDGIAGTGEGELSDFVWMDYKEKSECANDDEYYQQSFTIGIDPKLRDKLVGTEFDIQKNADYTEGIIAEGTAIPIRLGDHVSGQVKFYILGPVNAEWENITRRHPSFWRHTSWSQDSVALLSKANSIMMKDFKMEVVSDNGKIGAVSDNKDIVYISDTKETFVNKKDDLEMKITTALTSKECSNLGVNNAVKLSSPYDVAAKSALLSIYDRTSGTTAKPEQLYVDAYWQEWHDPRVVMTQNFEDEGDTVSLFNRYTHPAMGKTFHVEAISRDLSEGTAEVRMKEVF